MSEVLIFTPKHTLEANENYHDFMAFTKNNLTLFSEYEFNGEKGWACDKWEWVTDRGARYSILFGTPHGVGQVRPYNSQYADFMKAYARYEMSLRSKKSIGWFLSLHWIYKALLEQANKRNSNDVDILDINQRVVERTEELIRTSELSLGSKRNLGASLEQILFFLKNMRFVLELQEWKNPFSQRLKTSTSVDEESRKVELDKCPTDYQMLKVAEAFNRAETPRQKFYSSLCVMLICQPSRSIELNGLSIHSLQQSEKGRWYLSWYPAKGGTPVRKWIPEVLEDVVRQAFDRLIRISAPARLAAKFAYQNPGKFMISDSSINPEEISYDEELTFDKFADAMSLRAGPARRGEKRGWRWTNSQWINNLLSKLNGVSNWRTLIPDGCTLGHDNIIYRKVPKKHGRIEKVASAHKMKFPTFNDLVEIVYREYKTQTFPYYGDVPLWECITLVRDNEFNKLIPPKNFSWVQTGSNFISSAIQAKGKGSKSIFEELDITDEDGAALNLTSHQFRHWLNTKLIMSGEEDWLIARWSGRADVRQNKAYDGRTPEQKSRLTLSVGVVGGRKEVTTLKDHQSLAPYTAESPPPPVILHDLALPVPLKTLGVPREGVAQFTGLGYCVHNYAESPCVKNGDCVTCSEHVCLKGIPNTLDELRNLERLHQEQLAHAKSSVEEKVFGADRWVTSLGFKLSKIRVIIAMLEDPETDERTTIRLPSELDVSPVKRSLNTGKRKATTKLNLNLKELALKDL